jgi:hypothetical protein
MVPLPLLPAVESGYYVYCIHLWFGVCELSLYYSCVLYGLDGI